MAKPRLYLLSVLGALLLFAQQAAVTHALWHQANGKAQAAQSVERHGPQSDSRKASALCDFDAMLGQLLAGGAVAAKASFPVAAGAQVLPVEVPRLFALALVQPRSRGPPLVL